MLSLLPRTLSDVPSAALIAPLVLAVVLLTSAIGKLRSPSTSAAAFDALKVPAPLAGPWLRAAHPWAEIALAVSLLVLPSAGQVAAATAALALLLAYLWLVVRARTFEDPVDCACFGAVGSDRVTGWTVARNAWLVGLGVIALVSATDASPVLSRLGALGDDAWWVAAAAAAAVTVALVVGAPSDEPTADLSVAPSADPADAGDYLRQPIPHVPVALADGTTLSLRDVAKSRPQLLVHVSEMCGSCSATVTAVPEWRERLPEVEVRFLLRSRADQSPWASTQAPQSLHDPHGYAAVTMEMPRTPSAVLLGVDGLLAGGPVTGPDAIAAFVGDIADELAAARSEVSGA